MTDPLDPSELARQFRAALTELTDLHQQEVDELWREHRAQMDALTATYRQEIARLRAQIQDLVAELQKLRQPRTETP